MLYIEGILLKLWMGISNTYHNAGGLTPLLERLQNLPAFADLSTVVACFFISVVLLMVIMMRMHTVDEDERVFFFQHVLNGPVQRMPGLI